MPRSDERSRLAPKALVVSNQNFWTEYKCLLWQELHVGVNFKSSSHHEMPNCVTEIHEDGTQLPEWWATLYLYV